MLKWAKCITYIGIDRKFSWTPCQAGGNFGLDKAPHSLLRKSKARGDDGGPKLLKLPCQVLSASCLGLLLPEHSTLLNSLWSPVYDSYFQNILHCQVLHVSCPWILLPEHSTLLWSPCSLSMNFTSRTFYTVEVFMFPVHDPYFQSILHCWVPSNFLSTTLTCRVFSLFGSFKTHDINSEQNRNPFSFIS